LNETTQKRKSIEQKSIGVVYITISFLLTINLLIYYFLFQYYMKENIKHQLRDTAIGISSIINADELIQLRTKIDESSEEYLKIKDILKKFKVADQNIREIYTMRKTDEKDIWEFIVDAEDKDSKELSHIGDLYDVSNNIEIKKFYYGTIADDDLVNDEWGTTISGYAPIKDNKGHVVGIVGVDIGTKTFAIYKFNMLYATLIILFVSLLATIFIIKKIVGYYTTPINQIIYAINKVKEGNLNYRVSIKTNDEFEDIGEALNSTADILINYQKMLEKSLKVEREQKESIFKVYKDVIYSVTQGKFNLINNEVMFEIVNEGVSYNEMEIESSEKVAEARYMMNSYLVKDNYTVQSKSHIALCVSEAATNVIKHANSGAMQIRQLKDYVRVLFKDKGQGMDFDKLPKMIFLNGFSTKLSMGYGFAIIYKFADKVYLSTSENGTIVVMDFLLQYRSNEEEGVYEV